MGEHNILGKAGEEEAKAYLKKKGYKIIEQNRRTKRGEIDIIATYKNTLVFVEVRAKGSEDFGTPEETINQHKKQKLLRNAKAYMHYIKYKGFCRIDAICIVFDGWGGIQRITHYENIVEDIAMS